MVIFKNFTERKLTGKKNPRNLMHAIFICPICKQEIERPYNWGKKLTKCRECAKEITRKASLKHGGRNTRLYRTWINMRARCNNPKEPKYIHYGGKGIKICEEWNDFSVFRAFALSHGYNDNLTIDRIDVTKDYCPTNVQFIPNIINAGKDKLSITKELLIEIEKDITQGIPVKQAYTSRGISRGGYYGAKTRYNKN